MVAGLLANLLGSSLHDYVYIDFCAGGGGPTPSIERQLNKTILGSGEPLQFVLTDLHPHEERWSKTAESNPNISYEAGSVDASDVPPELIARYKQQGKKVFRLYNLAFHHFDDPLAKAILKNTIETSDGFA
jgi:hypothetical protein